MASVMDMRADEAIKEIDLAIYELAESERLERAAAKRRRDATKRIASVAIYFKKALQLTKENLDKQNQEEN